MGYCSLIIQTLHIVPWENGHEKSLIFDTTNCVPIKLPNFCSGI